MQVSQRESSGWLSIDKKTEKHLTAILDSCSMYIKHLLKATLGMLAWYGNPLCYQTKNSLKYQNRVFDLVESSKVKNAREKRLNW